MFAQLTDQEILKKIGERLKAYRLQQNVSVEDLGSRTGLSATTVVRAEAGRNPTLKTLIRILRALRRVDALETFLPEPKVSPIDLLERGSKQRRKHAYPQRRPGSR